MKKILHFLLLSVIVLSSCQWGDSNDPLLAPGSEGTTVSEPDGPLPSPDNELPTELVN